MIKKDVNIRGSWIKGCMGILSTIFANFLKV